MKKKLASELHSMNYELALNLLLRRSTRRVTSTNVHRGYGRTCSVPCSCFEHALFTSNNTVSVVLWADSRWLKVYHS